MDQKSIIFLVVVLLCLLFLKFSKVFVAWFRTRSKSYPLSLKQLFGMYFRGQDLSIIINAYDTIKRNDLDLTLEQLEMFLLGGGKAEEVIQEAQNCKNNYKTFNYKEYSKIYFKGK